MHFGYKGASQLSSATTRNGQGPNVLSKNRSGLVELNVTWIKPGGLTALGRKNSSFCSAAWLLGLLVFR